MDDPTKCPKCGSENLVTTREGVRLPPGAGGKLACGDCGRWIKWIGAPAAEFRMPLPKHLGKSLEEIARIDRPYLDWIANDPDFGDRKLKARVRDFLDRNPPPSGPAVARDFDPTPPRPRQEGSIEPWPQWKDPSWTPPW